MDRNYVCFSIIMHSFLAVLCEESKLTWYLSNSNCHLQSFDNVTDIKVGKSNNETMQWTGGRILYTPWLYFNGCYAIEDTLTSKDKSNMSDEIGLFECIEKATKYHYIYLNNESCYAGLKPAKKRQVSGRTCGSLYPNLLCGETRESVCEYGFANIEYSVVQDPTLNCRRCLTAETTLEVSCFSNYSASCSSNTSKIGTWIEIQTDTCLDQSRSCESVNGTPKPWSQYVRHASVLFRSRVLGSNKIIQRCLAKGTHFYIVQCDTKLSPLCEAKSENEASLASTTMSTPAMFTPALSPSSSSLDEQKSTVENTTQISKSSNATLLVPIIYALCGILSCAIIVLVVVIIFKMKIKFSMKRATNEDPGIIKKENGFMKDNANDDNTYDYADDVKDERDVTQNHTYEEVPMIVEDISQRKDPVSMESPKGRIPKERVTAAADDDARRDLNYDVLNESKDGVAECSSDAGRVAMYDHLHEEEEFITDYDQFKGSTRKSSPGSEIGLKEISSNEYTYGGITRDPDYDTFNEETESTCVYDCSKG